MIEVQCSNCGKIIKRKPHEVRRNKLFFCTKKCEGEYRSKHPTKKRKLNEVIVQGDIATIKVYDTKNNTTLDCIIDKEDVDKIKGNTWYIRRDHRHPDCTVYVESRDKKNKRIHLHHLIIHCANNLVIDHINGNGLDNRKENLRAVPQWVNALNRANRLTGDSNLGVSYIKRDKKWVASVCIKGKVKILGYYKTEENAKAKRKYINDLILMGEFDKLEEVLKLPCESEFNTKSDPMLYIYKVRDKYQVRIRNSKIEYYATFDSIEDAKHARDKIIESSSNQN